MKQLTVVVLLFISLSMFSQTNIQLHYDFGANRNYLTSTIERFKPDANGSLFYFIDFNYSANGPIEAYMEIARELKFWDAPFSAHIEYNGGLHSQSFTGFNINNAYLIGGTYSLNSKDFTKGISLSAMYKYIQKNAEPNNFQLTAVWYLHMLNRKVSFTGFADFWREKTFLGTEFIFLSEPQIWYNITDKISAGSEIEFGYNFGGVKGFNVCPTLAVKYNL
ncbi:MAG: hypothetical protein BGO29_05610 [Bacteroidales bacterium 36-12]|nr:MAG: hypothetical protein BGO29_05610 [Bacteroidales bacterium 36-12]